MACEKHFVIGYTALSATSELRDYLGREPSWYESGCLSNCIVHASAVITASPPRRVLFVEFAGTFQLGKKQSRNASTTSLDTYVPSCACDRLASRRPSESDMTKQHASPRIAGDGYELGQASI